MPRVRIAYKSSLVSHSVGSQAAPSRCSLLFAQRCGLRFFTSHKQLWDSFISTMFVPRVRIELTTLRSSGESSTTELPRLLTKIAPYPRKESNPHLVLRRDLLYPLSYGGVKAHLILSDNNVKSRRCIQ